jgi:hypothetical protein
VGGEVEFRDEEGEEFVVAVNGDSRVLIFDKTLPNVDVPLARDVIQHKKPN